jgi:hypothetical protein
MSGLAVWVAIAAVVVVLNRLLNGVVNAGRGEGGADSQGSGPSARSGRPADPRLERRPGRPADPRLDSGFLRDLAALAEAQARARERKEASPEPLWLRKLARGAPVEPAPAGREAPRRSEVSSQVRSEARPVPAPTRPATPATGSAPHGRVTLPAWSDRTALQRAILYQTVLGPPLALREEWGGWSGEV